MKKLISFALLLASLLPNAALAQRETWLPYRATGYKYLYAKKTDKIITSGTWKTAATTTWGSDTLAVGTLNNTTSPPCPLNIASNVHLVWPSSREVILRRTVYIPPDAEDVRLGVAVDNGVDIYLNGNRVTKEGPYINIGCAAEDQRVFTIEKAWLAGSGNNELAILGMWQNSKSYLDVSITSAKLYTIVATAGDNGTITPSGNVKVYGGRSQQFDIVADNGFHVKSISVGSSLVVAFPLSNPTKTINEQPTSSHQQYPYVYPPVTEDGSILAEFDWNYYKLTAVSAYVPDNEDPPQPPVEFDDPKIEVKLPAHDPGQTYADYYVHGTTAKLTAYTKPNYYFWGWTEKDANGQTVLYSQENPLELDATEFTRDLDLTAAFKLANPRTIEIQDFTETALRDAINESNTNPGTDIIQFAEGVVTSSRDLTLTLPLPILVDAVEFIGPTDAQGNPLVTLLPGAEFKWPEGSPAPNGFSLSGVFLGFGYTPEKATIRNFIIRDFPGAGICIGSDGNTIQNCTIVSNNGDGVCITGGNDNLIGGTGLHQGNRIYQNSGSGVIVRRKPVTDPPTIPTAPSGNAIVGNSIYENDLLGIDLIGLSIPDDRINGEYKDVRGITWNRFPDITVFPDGTKRDWSDYVNGGQNFPDLDFVNVSSNPQQPVTSTISGNLYGAPGEYRIEVFLNTAPEPSGNGEGKVLVGTQNVVIGGSSDGLVSWSAALTEPLFGGELLSASATAIIPGGAGSTPRLGSTSEFSPALVAGIRTRIFGPSVSSGPDDSWVVNTTYSGMPIHMPDGKGLFSIGESFYTGEGSAFRSAIENAFGKWNTGTANLVQYSLKGGAIPAGVPNPWGGAPDASNTVVYVSELVKWKDEIKAPEGALAVTRVRYNALTGEIVDADIALNGAYFTFRDEDDEPSSTTYDFLGVLVHEVGHFGGLGDRYNPGDPYFTTFMGLDVTGVQDTGPIQLNNPVTMYGIIRPLDSYQRQPWADDVAGLSFMYGVVPTAHVDVMLLFDGSQSFADPGSYNGFATSQAAAIELVDKLRPGDHVGVQKIGDAPVLFNGEALKEIPQGDDALAVRQQIKDAIAGLTPDIGDTKPLGGALLTAAGKFDDDNNGRRAIIAYTAGNETEEPYALSSDVLQTLDLKDISVYSAGGYTQSLAGQATLSGLSDATGGAYFLTVDTTVSEVTTQIWDLLTGYQLVGDSTMPSNAISWQGKNSLAISWQGTTAKAISWQGGTNNLAISWQGTADKGTTSILPAISWQGGGSSSLAKSTSTETVGDPEFLLALIPPGFDETKLYGTEGDVYGVITPTNWQTYSGVTYVEGPTYAFYQITSEFANNPNPNSEYLVPGATWGDLNGVWKLVPVGNNDMPLPDFPIPVYLSLTTVTDVVLLAELEKSTYERFEPVRISATLYEGGQVQGTHTIGGGPITDAEVSAVFTNASSKDAVIVPMNHTGNGVYRAQFSATGLGGTYNLNVRAVGTAPISGEPFTRESEQSFYVVPAYLEAVLFAESSITLGDGSTVNSGDVLVNRDATPGAPGYELYLGVGAKINGVKTPLDDPYYDIKADRIFVSAGAQVIGDLFTNELINNDGSVSDPEPAPLTFPVGGFPPLELADPGVSSADDFVVPNGQTLTLPVGVYGHVTLQPGSTLELEPGSFSMMSLRAKSGAKVKYSGPTRVRILKGMTGDNGSSFIPIEGSAADAADVIFFVQASDAQSDFTYAVNISPKSTIRASVLAPNGTILLNQETVAEGAFMARDIAIGQLVKVSLATAFNGLTKPSAGQGQKGTLTEKNVPDTYVLSQNYPNPFNPTTQIKYGLPQAGPVNLTIYNMLGQEVARLVDEVQPEGYHVVEWNGRNSFGSAVSTGMYVFQLKAGDFIQTKKMMLLK